MWSEPWERESLPAGSFPVFWEDEGVKSGSFPAWNRSRRLMDGIFFFWESWQLLERRDEASCRCFVMFHGFPGPREAGKG